MQNKMEDLKKCKLKLSTECLKVCEKGYEICKECCPHDGLTTFIANSKCKDCGDILENLMALGFLF
jgi:hypothetical protein